MIHLQVPYQFRRSFRLPTSRGRSGIRKQRNYCIWPAFARLRTCIRTRVGSPACECANAQVEIIWKLAGVPRRPQRSVMTVFAATGPVGEGTYSRGPHRVSFAIPRHYAGRNRGTAFHGRLLK